MGTPNFYTSDEIILNFADEHQDDEIPYFVEHGCKILEEKIESLNRNLKFHELEKQNGYYSGFQIMLKEKYSADEIWENYAKYWNDEQDPIFYDLGGYGVCVYLSPEAKDKLENRCFELSDLKLLFEEELKEASSQTIEIASYYGLGKIIGKSWTASVSYAWDNIEPSV